MYIYILSIHLIAFISDLVTACCGIVIFMKQFTPWLNAATHFHDINLSLLVFVSHRNYRGSATSH